RAGRAVGGAGVGDLGERPEVARVGAGPGVAAGAHPRVGAAAVRLGEDAVADRPGRAGRGGAGVGDLGEGPEVARVGAAPRVPAGAGPRVGAAAGRLGEDAVVRRPGRTRVPAAGVGDLGEGPVAA